MIQLEHVTMIYGKKAAVRDVTTVFPAGSFNCLVGPNGSGKSSLLRAMAGLCPCGGAVLLDGRNLSAFSRRERAAAVAYLPQTRAVPDIDVRTLISHGRFPYLGLTKTLSPQDHAIVEAAERTGVTALLNARLPALSGGKRQRVYLAMVVAQDAGTILLDEPAVYLDICHQLTLLALLEQLHRDGKTIVMAAHDLPQAFSCAGGVKLLSQGALVLEGAPRAIYSHPLIREVFGISLGYTGQGVLQYFLNA